MTFNRYISFPALHGACIYLCRFRRRILIQVVLFKNCIVFDNFFILISKIETIGELMKTDFSDTFIIKRYVKLLKELSFVSKIFKKWTNLRLEV